MKAEERREEIPRVFLFGQNHRTSTPDPFLVDTKSCVVYASKAKAQFQLRSTGPVRFNVEEEVIK
jgi:hypothetical protein